MSQREIYHLTDNMKKLIDKSGEGNEIRKMIDHWEKQYLEMRKEHNEESCAWNMMEYIDEEIKKQFKVSKKQIEEQGGQL